MHWVRADASDFGGTLPVARSGHTTVTVGKSKVVVFGGFADRKFLDDISVYDAENGIWFTPDCTGSGSDEQVGPAPRAFHVAVAIDCHMFVFGGRSGSKRLGDFWILDTDIWQWSEMTSFGDLPSSREFSAASAIGNRKIVMYGGWDGKKWLSDIYILDTISLEWTELSITGSAPPPRCGHTANMVEKRLLVFGGRGSGGPIMGDLWALKGLIEEENEMPGWTQLKLPGQSPSPRCGQTITSGGHYLLVFGGHGTGGWLSRYDIYHNDCIVLDRISVQWKRLSTHNEPPPPRAYHSMTCIGDRYLLFGGFDGKTTFGDIWWLVPEDDPISRRSIPNPPTIISESIPIVSSHSAQSAEQENLQDQSEILELQKKLGISIPSFDTQVNIVDEMNDKELMELSTRFAGEMLPTSDQTISIQALREHWITCAPNSIQLRELGALLRDYQRIIISQRRGALLSSNQAQDSHRFFHVKSASQLRMSDISTLLSEYQRLISN